MKTTALFILATAAWVAWVVTALAVEHHRERLQGAVVSNADYQQCVRVDPGPIRPRRVVLHPGNSELS